MATTDLTSTLEPRPDTVVERVRKGIPVAVLPQLITLRSWLAWSIPSVRADARRQMRFLLEKSRPEADIDAAARKYVKRMVARAEQRWHPELVTHLRVEGIEHLVSAREQGNGVVLSFMHHAEYDGVAATLARNGVPVHLVVYASSLRADAAGWLRQHLRLLETGGNRLVSTDVGAKGMLELLGQGAALAIASDVPGNTPVSFAGRTVLGPSGAARLAIGAGAPVVLLTFEADEQGPVARLHPALQPQDFDSPTTLLEAILAQHERVILTWPEAVDIPLSRWRLLEAAPAE
jgi:lauroyl/myristoyl acyltransferase